MKLSCGDHWFRFNGLFELPKPLCWKGWACYFTQVLFIFLLGLLYGHFNIFGEYSSSIMITGLIGMSIIIFMGIAVNKSNFRELSEEFFRQTWKN